MKGGASCRADDILRENDRFVDRFLILHMALGTGEKLRPVDGRTAPRRAEKLHRSFSDGLQISQLALPNHQHRPTRLEKPNAAVPIPSHVPLKLLAPEVPIRFREPSKRTIPVAMPKAAMNKDHLAPTGEHKVGFSGKFFVVQPVTVAHSMKHPPNNHFRARVLGTNQRHDMASLRDTYSVHNNDPPHPALRSWPMPREPASTTNGRHKSPAYHCQIVESAI